MQIDFLYSQPPEQQTFHLQELFFLVQIKTDTVAAQSGVQLRRNASADFLSPLTRPDQEDVRVLFTGRLRQNGHIGFERLILCQRLEQEDLVGAVADIFPGKLIAPCERYKLLAQIFCQTHTRIQEFQSLFTRFCENPYSSHL